MEAETKVVESAAYPMEAYELATCCAFTERKTAD
jgi:hypothetical protein